MNEIPTNSVLSRKASIVVNCDLQTAYDFISSSEKLPLWLKKSGPIPGAVSCQLEDGAYNAIGQKRIVNFDGGAHAEEQLIALDPPANYAYTIQHFSNFLEKLSGLAYGQLWFDDMNGNTRITWVYTFHYKHVFDRMVLSLFLTFVYKKFMRQSLKNAKGCLEN